MKLIYKDDECKLYFEKWMDIGFTLDFSDIYGHKVSRSYEWEDSNVSSEVDSDLRWWGISDSNEIMEKIFEFEV